MPQPKKKKLTARFFPDYWVYYMILDISSLFTRLRSMSEHLLLQMKTRTRTRTNARRKPITVTLTLNVTTLLAHLTVLVYKGTWEMACNVLVRITLLLFCMSLWARYVYRSFSWTSSFSKIQSYKATSFCRHQA